MATSPSARSLQHLRKLGYIAQVVERFNPFAHVRQDLFGFIDIVAVKEGEPGVLGVQATSADHISHRKKKAEAIDALKVWLAAGNKFVVHGWSKKGARGKIKHWTLTEKETTLETLLTNVT